MPGANLQDPQEQGRLLVELTQKLAKGQKSLVDFREQFFPARKDVKSAKFHHEWSDVLLNGTLNYAIEGFRESAKTTYVMRTFPVHCLVYPDYDLDFIVLISSDEDTARDKLSSIKAEYTSKPYLMSNLVEVIENNEDAYEVLVKPYGGGDPIPVRIEVFGKGSQIRGLVS